MEITYSLTKEDLWNIKNSSKSKSKKFKATAIGGIILFISSLMVAFRFFESITLSILSVIPIIVLYFLAKSPESKKVGLKSIQCKDYELEERTISIDSERISLSKNFQNSSMSWELINKIEIIEEYIHIFAISKPALIIPKKSFNTEDEALKFYNKANEYFENNKEQIEIETFDIDMMTHMKLAFRLEKEDILRCREYSCSKSQDFKRCVSSFILSSIGLPIGLFIIFNSIKISLIVTIPMMLLHILALHPGPRRTAFKAVEDHYELQKQSVTISPDGISKSTNFQESFYMWNSIAKIENTNEYIYLFTNELMTIIVPKRIFNIKDEALKFYNTALDYFENNKKINIDQNTKLEGVDTHENHL